jgi:hypothetical protein
MPISEEVALMHGNDTGMLRLSISISSQVSSVNECFSSSPMLAIQLLLPTLREITRSVLGPDTLIHSGFAYYDPFLLVEEDDEFYDDLVIGTPT